MLRDLRPHQLKDREFRFAAGVDEPSVEFRFWATPKPDAVYVIGADFAYGTGRDRDTAIVLDLSSLETSGQLVQVATYEGQLGSIADRYLYALARYFKGRAEQGAYVLGEAQVGALCLQRLWDEYSFFNQYLRRQHEGQGTSPQVAAHPLLGFPATGERMAMNELREAVVAKRLLLTDPKLVDEMGRLQWAKPAREDERHVEDRKLVWELRGPKDGKKSPDLVMALAYAVLAARFCPRVTVAPTSIPPSYTREYLAWQAQNGAMRLDDFR